MQVRQMCGGGTWRRRDLTRLRRTDSGAVIADGIGWGLFPTSVENGPLTIRFHGRWRARAADRSLGLLERAVRPLLAQAWERGAYEMGEFVATNPGPSEIPSDPPSNPYERR